MLLLLLLSDWLPTLLSAATAGQWSGGLAGQDFDGRDMWSNILSNVTVTGAETVHYSSLTRDSGSVQLDMIKLDVGLTPADVDEPTSVFSEDLEPARSVECSATLSYASSQRASLKPGSTVTSSVTGAGAGAATGIKDKSATSTSVISIASASFFEGGYFTAMYVLLLLFCVLLVGAVAVAVQKDNAEYRQLHDTARADLLFRVPPMHKKEADLYQNIEG